MRLTRLRPDELGPENRARWHTLRAADRALASPCFCPELVACAAAARREVWVTVLEDAGQVVGFFPFERGPLGAGRPVTGPLSDHHGVVAAPGTTWDVRALLRASGLASWSFDHLPAGQAPFAPFHRARAESPLLDLSRGYDAWRAGRLAAGSGRLPQLERKARKLAREVGPLRFETHAADAEALRRVFEWKSEQCRRTGVPDFFARAWTRELVERVLATQGPAFAGRLSVLRAGERLVAAHAGMRSDRAWHWWFPVYDRELPGYSPGGILLLEVAKAAAAEGMEWLDLGKGDDAYKASFADAALPLAEGRATRASFGASVTWLREHGERLLRASAGPLRPLLRRAGDWARARAYA